MKTKDKIVAGLVDLMKTEVFENITVKQITLNAEVNRSTYYRNFTSKEDIISYQLHEILDEYIDEFKKQEVKNRTTYIHTILETFKKHEDFFKIIHKQNQSYLLSKVLIDYFKDNLELKNRKELYEAYYHIGGIYNFTICWIEHDMVDDTDYLTEIGTQITENIQPLYEIE